MRNIIRSILMGGAAVVLAAPATWGEGFDCKDNPCTCVGKADCRHMENSGLCLGPLRCSPPPAGGVGIPSCICDVPPGIADNPSDRRPPDVAPPPTTEKPPP
jgi:hypothetical protein